MNRVALPVGMAAARGQLGARWRALAPRERQWVGGALVALGLLLVALVAVRPAWRSLAETPAQLDAVEAQLQQMQRLAAETRELRGLPSVAPAQAEAALRAATERLGPAARLTLQGDRATVALAGVDGAALTAWLGEVRSAARTRPDEAQLTLGPGGYSGSLVLSLPRQP